MSLSSTLWGVQCCCRWWFVLQSRCCEEDGSKPNIHSSWQLQGVAAIQHVSRAAALTTAGSLRRFAFLQELSGFKMLIPAAMPMCVCMVWWP